MDPVEVGWPLAVLLVLLAVLAAGVVATAGLGDWRAPLTASLRAVAQLLLVSAVITVVLRSLLWSLVFVLVMVAVAAGTACRRLTGHLGRPALWLLVPVLGGVAPALGLALASGVVPLHPVAVLPVAGILVGGAMTATTLAVHRVQDELEAHRGSYEAALAIGLTRRQAVGLVARPAAALALVPGTDQTRTVGLVTLPGAYVGVLLGGGSAVQAGAAQVLVLVALLAVQAVAAAAAVELVAAARVPVSGRALPA